MPILFVALFLFGVIAALFGPIKYGILPDHLKSEELPAGNALVEGATFMAILLGTIVGGLAAKDGGHPALFGAMIMVFAVLCWASSLLIPRTGEGAPDLTHRREHRALDRRAAEGSVERQPPVVGRPGRRAGSGWSARSCCRCCRRW